MNALTRYERLDDMFPEMFRRFMRPMIASGLEAPGEIRIEVTENEKDYEVRAEVPGAKKDDIKVTIDRNHVSIDAEVRREKEERSGKGGRTLVSELYYGSTSRSFSLAQEVEEKASSAKFDNGVLTLLLPKKREASSRSLKIE